MKYDEAIKIIDKDLNSADVIARAINTINIHANPELLPMINQMIEHMNEYTSNAGELWDESQHGGGIQ
jgi:hypothetical protein